MPAATLLRIEIERSLANRFPAALSPAPRVVEAAPTGIAEVDNLLDGGLPTGAITELAGAESSGRTSLALAFVARLTGDGRACAWVDTDDTLDPESAAANGVVLRQLLWVRCRGKTALAKDKPWPLLEQAIRATDLLLQAGGFAAIVLDLAGTAPEHAMRIPLATWFRFRQAATRTRCSLVLLDQTACAQSSATAVLECGQFAARDSGNTVLEGFTFTVHRSLLRPGATSASVGMPKPGFPAMGTAPGGSRKPPVSVWPADCPWNPEKRA
jgi:hypothetical protein